MRQSIPPGTPSTLDWFKEAGSDELPALGFLEFTSISRGLFVTDIILKKAPVRVLSSHPISSGKHVILYFGDVASVTEAHEAALGAAESCLVKQVLIPGVHRKLTPFLDSIWEDSGHVSRIEESLGIVESQTLAGAILAADRALKAADVSLCRMRLGQGIGGKAYFVLTGRQDETEAAVAAAEMVLKELDSLARVDLIARPSDEVLVHF